MSFKDLLAVDANNIFLDTNVFSEKIIYCPYGGQSKYIKANIDRGEGGTADDEYKSRRTASKIYIIEIANDSVTGVDYVREGKDIVILSEAESGRAFTNNDPVAAYSWLVSRIIGKDSGMWTIEITK